MPMKINTRVPIDEDYVTLVGAAVYLFAYYEWCLVWVVDSLRSGFVGEYSRAKKPITSGSFHTMFLKVVDDPTTDFTSVSKEELVECAENFDRLIQFRNALIHAHPCTDAEGQILAYQSSTSKVISDKHWPVSELQRIIALFDEAACNANSIKDRLSKRGPQ